MDEQPKFILKITLLGEKNVGKTSLVYRYIENKFRENYKATLGVNLLKKDMEVDGNGISAQIWDLGGQESFKSLRKLYLEGANGALVIFDLTDRKTFDKLNEWLENFKEARGNQPIVLIGNKSDLENQRKITDMEASNYAKDNNMDLILTSAKTGKNVEEAFIKLTRRIFEIISNQQ
jgi:small GTP-binding protein